jgi:uncharacterized RDD family membrane protein YckC
MSVAAAHPRYAQTVRTSWRRLLAWLIDWVAILAWVGVVAAIGIPLYLAGGMPRAGALVLNVISGVLVVVPVTVALVLMEAGSRHATLGKRVVGLHVALLDGGVPLRFPRSLLRNSLKVAIPWLIGHSAVFALTQTDDPNGGAIALTVCSYVLPIIYLVALFVRGGRTPYDWISGTRVVESRAHLA